MQLLIVIASIVLLVLIVIQVSKLSELATRLKGEEEAQRDTNRHQGNLLFLFVIAFFVLFIVSGLYFKNYYLGFGPHEAASEHGKEIDWLFRITLIITGIVFFITQFLLFFFAWKFRGRKGHKAQHISHDSKLEIIWTLVPAITMTLLVIGGMDVWNKVMPDVEDPSDLVQLEVTGYQFAWDIRYPGPDNELGNKNFRLISSSNPLGQDWTDKRNLDDFHASEIVLPVGKQVRVRITAKDVLHSFYLPQFRVKMDAVPGMPTYFIFTPTKTTEEYRKELSAYPEYQQPSDPEDPNSPPLWQTFNYELACAELCGIGHYSMRRIVKVVSEEEFKKWASEQPSFFMTNIRGTDEDPYKGEYLEMELKQHAKEYKAQLEKAIEAENPDDKIVRLKYVTFETGSAKLSPLSRYELDRVVETLKEYPHMKIEIAGHTDNTGDADANLKLSQQRAEVVRSYLLEHGIEPERLTAKGYGSSRPQASNETEEGRQENRRTEFKILDL